MNKKCLNVFDITETFLKRFRDFRCILSFIPMVIEGA